MAATYKKRFFRDGLLTRMGFGIPRYARGNGCGDVGQAGRLRPGDVEDIPLAGMPSYWLRDQPLPRGIIHPTVGFVGSRRADRVSVLLTDPPYNVRDEPRSPNAIAAGMPRRGDASFAGSAPRAFAAMRS